MALKKIKAVGFDLDDTLVMSETAAFEFENKILKLMGRSPMNRGIHQATWGQHIAEAIAQRSPGVDVKQFMALFQSEWQKYLESNSDLDKLSPEVDDLLHTLGQKGYYLFILTGRDGFETAHIRSAGHSLAVHFAPENIYHKDNLEFPKPDPRAFNWLFKLGYKPEECLFIGDSTLDAQAATGANVNFVATLESGLKKPEDFKDYPVAAFINNLGELPNLLV
jgi:phosphoglycolate phosphatase